MWDATSLLRTHLFQMTSDQEATGKKQLVFCSLDYYTLMSVQYNNYNNPLGLGSLNLVYHGPLFWETFFVFPHLPYLILHKI